MFNSFAIPSDSNINTLNDLKEILNNERCDFNNTISTSNSEMVNYFELNRHNFNESSKNKELLERDVIIYDEVCNKKYNSKTQDGSKERKIMSSIKDNDSKILNGSKNKTRNVLKNILNKSNSYHDHIIKNYSKYIWEIGDEFSELHSLSFI